MSDGTNGEGVTKVDDPTPGDQLDNQDSAGGTDWVKEARKWEALAKKNFAEAKQNADAAKKLTEIEEANKTESEKSAERIAIAESRAVELEFQVNRAGVANEFGIPIKLLEGPESSSVEHIEEFAKILLTFRGEKDLNPVIPAEGSTPPLSLNGGGIEDALRNALGVK